MTSEPRYVVVDVEGNGQRPPEIVEVALVTVDGLDIVGEPRSWLVRPTRPISLIVTRKVHGITNADVAGAPTIIELGPELLDAFADRIPVAHNASVERAVLGEQLPAWKPPTMLDTLRLARKVWSGLPGYGLDALIAHAALEISDEYGARHRALFDAYATARLFINLAREVNDHERLTTWAALPADVAKEEGALW